MILSRTPGGAHTRRLAEACAARRLDPLVRGPAFRHDGPPGLIVTRLPSGSPPDALAALAAHEAAGWAAINRAAAVAVAHDKPAALQRLAAAGLEVPPSIVVRRDEEPDVDAVPGARLAIKPVRGSGGHGVLAGLDRAAALAGARAFADACAPVLVQAHVEGVERRLVVVGDRVVVALEKRATDAEGRANLQRGADVRPFAPDRRATGLALAATRALGLDVAAVDVIGDGVVLEVNACPGVLGTERSTGVDVAGAIADLAARRLGVDP